jgi:ethanolaminephosphotransferase
MINHFYHLRLAGTNILVTAGVILFIVGFFRGRPLIPHHTSFDVGNRINDVSAAAPFDKIIFMMVDALRRY